jgi:Flp pilus assembly protein TadG
MRWIAFVRRSLDDRGQALVEFALVLPLLALVVFGAAQLAQGTNYWEQANHVANETARWAAVNRLPAYNYGTGCGGSVAANTAPAPADYQAYMNNELCSLNFGPNAVKTVSICWTPATVGATPTIGDDVTVDVRLTWPIPLVHNLTSLTGFGASVGTLPIHGDSTMRLEQTPSSTTGAICP